MSGSPAAGGPTGVQATLLMDADVAPGHPSKLVPLTPDYTSIHGAMYCCDALDLLQALPADSVNLVVTSPPYALEFKKEYGNAAKDEYVRWFRPFAQEIRRVLHPQG